MNRPLFRRWTTADAAEFHLDHPENFLLVKKERDGGVLICTTANNLSAEQQATFVDYLRAEGFISCAVEPPDRLQGWLPSQDDPPVRWIVDPSWPEIDPAYVRHLRRLCWYMAGTMIVWLALMAALVCG